VTFIPLLWLIPLLPLAGFLVNGLLGKRFLPKRAVAAIGCGTVLLSFLIGLGAVRELSSEETLTAALRTGEATSYLAAAPHESGYGAVIGRADPDSGLVINVPVRRVRQIQYDWVPLETMTIRWSYALDPLSAVMLLVVTGVGFLIHVYSIGYMAHDEGFARFFSYLNLFMAMMLVLVLADNFLVMFVGWEGVGLCSYLLIGFNYRAMFEAERGMSCADAGRKAFIVNRMGDFGFMLAIKSAQIPLYVWLPDAMAGPTPVSALIHAATMVTAGVYMVCRCAAIFSAAPWAMAAVAVIGATTALLAALIGCTQFDIKKVLAYSTVSQLGYMFLAAGVGAFSFATFHIMTHAFFKALLFLGAGSVIHALAGEQDIRRMGRLGRALPWTFWTFIAAAVAIAGLPPAAGFFSKDSILAATWAENRWLWGVAAFTAGLTAFYIWRLVFTTFLSTDRVEPDRRAHLHESPWSMRSVLVVLAILSLAGGVVGVPAFLARFLPGAAEILPHYLQPVFDQYKIPGGGMGSLGHEAASTEWLLMLFSVLLALAGVAVAALLYARGGDLPGRIARSLGGAYRLARDRFRVDELYEAVILRPFYFLTRLSDAIDRYVVDMMVNAAAIVTEIAGHVLKLFQTGEVRAYALSFFLGVLLILGYLVLA
jgi:NADH-quinone oxidoreductase subunit L